IVMERGDMSLDQALQTLGGQSGLLGLSGLSGDVRDLEQAADEGHAQARLALDVYVTSVRHYLGAYLVELGGVDVIAFAGGIGENGARIRAAVCEGLNELGIVLDPEANRAAQGEAAIHAPESRAAIWVTPTNEESIVARQTYQLLQQA
ncbi:MAG: acetate/propionate family kinase, partial [Planctomycetales bacterium]|nr:acetate/propionate family kinase [Planctomycetales bacterium]